MLRSFFGNYELNFYYLNVIEELKKFSIVDGTIEWECGAELSNDTFYLAGVAFFMPLASMFGYTGDRRSMSQGRAASTMELAHYEEVPPNVAQEIIAKRSK